MLNKCLSSKVLTIGCKYIPPRGGIAQVLWNYDKYIFKKFKFVENSRKSSPAVNLIIAFWAIIKMTAQLICDKQIKIVHIHTASEVSFKRSTFFQKIAKLFGKKVIMHIHGGGFEKYYNKNKEFVTRNLKRCDQIITLSQDWVDFYKSIGFDSSCVENVIPEPTVQNIDRNDVIHFLYLGLIVERKGIYDLLDVVADHKQSLESKMILHIGGNGEVERLKEIITNQELEDIVVFEGWVDSDKKLKLLNLCDVFILPSYVEGLPLSILEAMSYNMSIITTPVGGIPSLIHHKENGLLFNPGNKVELFNAIQSLINKEIQLSPNYKDVEKYYPQNVANKLSTIYQSLL